MARGRRVVNRSPFHAELSLIVATSNMGYVFPWNTTSKTYDTSSFHPVYSDGRISIEEVNALIADLKTLPLYDPEYTDPLGTTICYVLLGLLVSILILILGGLFLANWLFSLIPVVFVSFIIFSICINFKIKKNENLRAAERKLQVDSVINRHQQSTFSEKGTNLRMTPHGAFVIIEFLFRMYPGAGGQMSQGMGMQSFAQGGFAQPTFQAPNQQQQPFYVAGQQPQPKGLSAPLF